jgi:hypothetical protein
LSSKNWMVCHSQNPGPIRQALIMGSPLSHSHCVKHPGLAQGSQAIGNIRKLHTLRWRAVSWHRGDRGSFWGSTPKSWHYFFGGK